MKYVMDIIRGILIGVANVIPGVSGGTMAVSLGVYDRLISSLTGLFKNKKKPCDFNPAFYWNGSWSCWVCIFN